MDKLEKVCSPGAPKDDEVLHGDPEATRASAGKQTDSDRPDHSIMRQLVNPAGDKYDEQAFGTTAATAGDRKSSVPITTTEGTIDPNEKLETDKGQKGHSILRQIINPHGKKYDSEGYGTTAHEAGQSSSHQAAVAAEEDSSEPLPWMRPDHNLVADKQVESPRTEPTQSQTQSSLGRDAAIAGGASALGGRAAYAAPRDRDESSPSNTTSGGTSSVQNTTGREFGYDQSAQTASATAPALSSTTGQPAALSAIGRDNQTAPQTSDSSHLGRDAAIAGGVGAVGAGGAYAATPDRDHNPTSSATTSSTIGASGQTDGLADGRSAERAANEQSGQHNYGRDATLASGVAAGGTLGPHEADKHREQQGDNLIVATGTAPISRPLDGDSNIATGRTVEASGTSDLPNEASRLESGAGSGINPTEAPEAAYAGARHLGSNGTTEGSGSTEQSGAGSTGLGSSATAGGIQYSNAPGHGHINPVGAPEESLAGAHHHAVLGAGVHNDTGPDQLNQAPADVQAATYTYSSQPVGSTFGPHVPGEFPTETGQDPHETSISYGATAGGSQLAPLAGTSATSGTGTVTGLATRAAAGSALGASDTPSKISAPQQSSSIPVDGSAASTQPATQDYPIPSATDPTAPKSAESQQHNYGRDAGIAGGALGVGALGAGVAHEATQGRDHAAASAQAPLSSTTQSTSQPGIQLPPPRHENHPSTHETTTTTTQPTTQQSIYQDTPVQKEESGRGRDAALAGGAGAAGAGAAYAATRDRNDTGPAPNTIGPHDSDVKNILDPRVKPDTAVQGSQKNQDPAIAAAQKAAKDHRYETRDAALATGAGGAGAAAAAAYGTTHDVYGEEDPNKHNKLHKPTPDEKKHDKELEKEQKKYEKEAEKEQKKAEKEAEKEQKKAEKEAEKEQKKAKKEAGKEKKPSLLDRILHPGRHDSKETEDVSNEKTGHNKGDLDHPLVAAAEVEQAERQAQNLPPTSSAAGGTVIEPHTGLPMNVDKFGDGHGGTDGTPQIEGYHETDPALRNASIGTGQGAGTKAGHAQPGQEGVAGPDWDAIKKANTPY